MDQARFGRPIGVKLDPELDGIFDIQYTTVAQSFGLMVAEVEFVVFCVLSSMWQQSGALWLTLAP